jgi:hypothetical protein
VRTRPSIATLRYGSTGVAALVFACAAAVAPASADTAAAPPAPAPLTTAQVAAAKAADDRPGTDGYLPPALKASLVKSPGYVSPAKAAYMKAHPATPAVVKPALGGVVGSGSGWAELWADQQPQQTSYWCGPAALVEALQDGAHGTYSQSWAAGVLHTSSNGGTPGGEINPALNAYSNGFPYDEVTVPGSGWQSYVGPFESHVADDIVNGVGEAPTAVAYEVPGGPHLVGHPENEEIFHFFEIDGYFDSGATIRYADSATSIWSSVPPYSNYDSSTLVEIISGRSYDW